LDTTESPEAAESVLKKTGQRSILGLSDNLWRLALVVGVAQFSWSIWGWLFGIFLETIVEPWQMALTFSAGTIAMIIGLPISGYIADMVGRKRTMVFSFIPLSIGILMLALIPIWPLLPLAYGLASFGWSFVLIISKAVPADEIAADGGRNAARRFTMILLPAFLVDGLSPAIASGFLIVGFTAKELLLMGAGGAIVAMFATIFFVKESLSVDIRNSAREGTKIPFRNLGRTFWILAAGMLPFMFVFNMALPYFGNLCVGEWGIDPATFGLTWSAFSLTSVLLMYAASGWTDRSVRGALLIGIVANALILIAFGVGSGVLMLFLFNILWAVPVVFWIGAERALVVSEISNEMKGRALGFYSVLMSSTSLLAAPFGAYVWTTTGSLRVLWVLAGVLGLDFAILLALALWLIGPGKAQGSLGSTEQPS
jgi:MFS family permease